MAPAAAVAAAAISRTTMNGQFRWRSSSAVVYAPMAMNAPWPSEIWPLSPVSTVSPATAVTSIAISAIW